MPSKPNGNGRNGLFVKVIMGVLTAGLLSASVGMVKLYREVGEMHEELKRAIRVDQRLDSLEAFDRAIGTDRDKRTIILDDIHRRLDVLEGRRR